MKTMFAIFALTLTLIPAAHAATSPRITPLNAVTLGDGATILADTQGLSAYVFDRDQGSVSACYDACAKAWPPILTNPSVKLGTDLGVTTRRDGSLQVTYQGRPIYLYVGDGKPGDVNGDGLGGVWHLIEL